MSYLSSYAYWNQNSNVIGLHAFGNFGARYDLSDFSSLFQDAAGTIPVTAVGQPVGLMLDKSNNLERGEELVTNGTFDTNLTGWTEYNPANGDAVVSGGEVKIDKISGIHGIYQDGIAIPAGSYFRLSFDCTALTGNAGFAIYTNGGFVSLVFNGSNLINTVKSYQYTISNSSAGDLRIYFLATSNGNSVTIDNISIRELPGYHASQSTSTKRPVLASGVDGNYYLDPDLVDDDLVVTISQPLSGTMIWASKEGTVPYGVYLPAGTYSALNNSTTSVYSPVKDFIGQVTRQAPMASGEVDIAYDYFNERGSGPTGVNAYSGVTNFSNYWRDATWLTEFPLVDTRSATNLFAAWYNCSNLSSFPAINTSGVTNFQSAWSSCSNLSSFPAINTSSAINLLSAWNSCSSLTSFPTIQTSSATSMRASWYGCSSLTSFPLLDTSSVNNASLAWYNCTSLANFPASFFNSTPCINFTDTFVNCALTQESTDNILESIDTASTSNGTLNMHGGTSSGPSLSGVGAKRNLRSRNWTVTTNLDPLAEVSGIYYFGDGEGPWYDVSDFDTMYQQAYGRDPVTDIGQPVALLLDKSQGGISQENKLPSGSTVASGWVAYSSNTVTDEVDGSVLISYVDNSEGAFIRIHTLYPAILDTELLHCFRFEAKVSTGSVQVRFVGEAIPASVAIASTSYQTFELFSKGDGGLGFLFQALGMGPGESINIRNLQVLQVPGYHAYQTTSTSRPVLGSGADGGYYLINDLVDDRLVVNLPTTSGIAIIATEEGTAAYGVYIPSGDYNLLTNTGSSAYTHQKKLFGDIIRSNPLEDDQVEAAYLYFADKKAGPSGADAYGGVTNFIQYWRNATWLTDFPLIDTSNATNFFFTWYGCNNLRNFPALNSSNVTNFQGAWFGCNKLTNFPLIDTSKATNVFQAWAGCNSLSGFPLIDTSQVTSFGGSWTSCSNLTDFPAIDTSKGLDFGLTWQGCNKLTDFPLIDTSQATSFFQTWINCSSLSGFPAINTSNVSNFSRTWQGCSNIVTFPQIDCGAATNLTSTWGACSKLENFPSGVFNNTTGTVNFSDTFANTRLDSQSLDNVLLSVNNADTSSGIINLNSTNMGIPGAGGAAAKLKLEGRDWEVNTKAIDNLTYTSGLFYLDDGAWYDVNDLSTLYQDSIGSIPVTATGQPVGLMLDKSKGGLQAEQAINGGFDTATDWALTGSATIAGGELVFSSGMVGLAELPVSFNAGETVRLAIDKTVLGATGAGNAVLRLSLGAITVTGISIGGANGPRSYEAITTLSSDVDNITISYNGAGTYEYKFDNVSARKLPGYHAKQPTSTSRPVLASGVNGEYYLDSDGVDDRLLVDLPAITGTAVIASEEGTVAYGVNIPASTHPLITNTTSSSYSFAKDLVGQFIRQGEMTSGEVAVSYEYFADKNAGPTGVNAYSGVTNLQYYWRDASWLTRLPLINTSSATNLNYAWYNCQNLLEFPLIDTSNVTSFAGTWYASYGLTKFPLIDTSAGTNFVQTWAGCQALTEFPLLDFGNAVNLAQAWYGCQNLSGFPAINTSNVANMSSAWYNCVDMVDFPLIDTSNVTGGGFNGSWRYCYSISGFPLIDTSKGTTFGRSWERNFALTEFPLLDFSSATDLQYAWVDCNNLLSFPAIDTSGVTNFTGTWQACSSLSGFPLINTSSSTGFTSTWYNCTNLLTFPLLNTSQATSLRYAWRNCQNISEFPLIDTSKVGDFFYTWNDCFGLSDFPAIDCRSATNLDQTWRSCTNLENFPAGVFDNTSGTVNFSTAFTNTRLNTQSVDNVIVSVNNANTSSGTLTLNFTNMQPPSYWGLTAADELSSRDWTVSTKTPTDEDLLDATIAPLYFGGDDGAWYDVSDLDTMFQDSVGTTPVTETGQPVGLILDKSKGLQLGNEVLVNPTWSVPIDGFVSDGELHFTGTTTVNQTFTTTVTGFAPGKRFLVEFEVFDWVAGSVAVLTSNNVGGGTTVGLGTGNGLKTAIVPVGSIQTFLIRTGSTGGEFSIRNISLRELPGNHASQSTSTSRPTLKITGTTPSTLGEELVTNGTFDTDTTGWLGIACALSINSNALRITDTDGGIGYARQAVTVEVGKTYSISADVITDNVTGPMYLFVGTTDGSSQLLNASISSGTGTISGLFTATSTTAWVSLRNTSAVPGEYWEVDNVSLREVETWADPKYYLEGDGVDDRLLVTIPEVVGTAVISTDEGTAAYGVNIPAGSYALITNSTSSNYSFQKELIGSLFHDGAMTSGQITTAYDYFGTKRGGLSGVDAYSGVTSVYAYWNGASWITEMPKINTSSVTNFSNAWDGCTGLSDFPLIDTSNGSNFGYAWRGCNNLSGFPLIDTSSAVSMNVTWNDCRSLSEFPLIDTSNVTSFYLTWRDCTSLTDFPLIDTSKGINFQGAWQGNTSLSGFPLLNLGSATNLGSTWANCTSLASFPQITPSSCTTFSYTWAGCNSLTDFPLIDTSQGTTFANSWQACSSLSGFPQIDTSNGTNLNNTWYGCSSLVDFPALDFSSATSFIGTWQNCTNLANFPSGVFNNTSATNMQNVFLNAGLSQQSVDNVLLSVNTAGTSSGRIDITGGTNASPGVGGSAAKNRLEDRGWTVNTKAIDTDTATSGLFYLDDGAWYDVNDLTTLYQDSAGTTPVTAAGQPVGLLLDKSRGLVLGEELVTNGTFDGDDSTGWSLVTGSTVSGEKLVLNDPVSNVVSSYAPVVGKSYQWTFTISDYVSGALYFYMGGQTRKIASANGTYSGIADRNSAVSVRFLATGDPVLSIDNISIKELPGYHAYQPTSTSRPTLQGSSGNYYLDSDGVDDRLLVDLPAITGTAVIASEEGTAAYGVSIPEGTHALITNNTTSSYSHAKDLVGQFIRQGAMNSNEIATSYDYFTAQNAGPTGVNAYSGLATVQEYWRGASWITEFPLINTSNATSFSYSWKDCTGLSSFPLIDSSQVTNFVGAWNGCSNLTTFPLLNTSAATSVVQAWYYNTSLSSFPLIDTSQVTAFQQAWQNCTSLQSFPLIDTSQGVNFSQTWYYNTSLTSFPLINTSNATNFFATWSNCTSLTSFPLIDTSKATAFTLSWYNCRNLSSFPLIDTSKATQLDNTWTSNHGLSSFPQINTSVCRNFVQTWYDCIGLTTFPLIDTGQGINFQQAWQNCYSLTSFPQINTSSGTNFQRTWFNCDGLSSFPQIDCRSATNLNDTWYGCDNLENFPAGVFDNTSGTVDFSTTFEGTRLNSQSIDNVITSINNANTSSGTLTLNSTNMGSPGISGIVALEELKSRDWTVSIKAHDMNALEAEVGALFASGEVGAWYDPSDLDTMFEDAAGTIPVSGAGQPVGLLLDKSQGLTLGSELSNPATQTLGSATGTASGNGWNITATGGFASVLQTNILTASTRYKVRFKWSGNTNGRTIRYYNGGTGGSPSIYVAGTAESGDVTFYVITGNQNLSSYVQINDSVSGDTFYIEITSIRELPGNHAAQTTSTSRPTLQISNGKYYLDFDGVDDLMKSSSFTAISNPITAAIGMRPEALTDFIFDGQSDNQMSLRILNNLGVDSLRMVSSNSSAALLYAPATINADQVARCIYDNTNSILSVNGAETSGAVAGGTSVTQFTIGNVGGPSNIALNGRIYGFVGVNRTLTSEEIRSLETYLAVKTLLTN